MAVATKRKSEIRSYLNNGYDVMNYFAKFEKFLPNSIIIPSFMTVIGGLPPSYKLASQNTPYKLGLMNGMLSIDAFNHGEIFSGCSMKP